MAGKLFGALKRLAGGVSGTPVGESSYQRARQAGRDAFADGDFALAAEQWQAALALNATPPASLRMDLGRALRALSRYDEARAQFEAAVGNANERAKALGELMELDWILGRDEQVEARYEEAHAADPSRPRPASLRARLAPDFYEAPVASAGRDPKGANLHHVAFYVAQGGNFGDAMLPWSVRWLLESELPVAGWSASHVHRLVTEESLETINASDGLVIGGGGLFLPDTMPNANSGWQWNIPTETLERIEVPVAVTAVGLNLFYGQGFRGDTFTRSLHALAGKASMFGLRNSGSVGRVKEMLPAELAEKVVFVPCPTTVTDLIRPDLVTGTVPDAQAAPIVHLNIAFDRAERRYGEAYPAFVAQIAGFAAAQRAAGVELRYLAHSEKDEPFVAHLEEASGIRLEIDRVYAMPLLEGLELYRRSSLVIGMRGHAAMVPFGVGTPVLSLVSHPKLQYFLDDIGQSDWGYPVAAPDLGAKLSERVADVVARPAEYRQIVVDARARLHAASQASLAPLGPLLSA